jgi:DNA-binding transcriptional regulator YiaG
MESDPPHSSIERLLILVRNQPGTTSPGALRSSGASADDLRELRADGRIIEMLAPAPKPDRLGRQREALRLYPRGHQGPSVDVPRGLKGLSDSQLVEAILARPGWNVKRLAATLKVSRPVITGYRKGLSIAPMKREALIGAYLATRNEHRDSLAATDPPAQVRNTVTSHPGESPASVIGRAKKLKGFDIETAEDGWTGALHRNLVHIERRSFIDKAGHPRVRFEVLPGPGDGNEPDTKPISARTLATRRNELGLSQATLARLVCEKAPRTDPRVARGTIDSWERSGVPLARVPYVRAALDGFEPPEIDEVAAATAAISCLLSEEPGLAETQVIESHERAVGKTVATIRALQGMRDRGEVVSIPVFHHRSRSHQGLYLKAAAPPPSDPLTREELRRLRDAAGLSQGEAARICATEQFPISSSLWRQWDRGARQINQLLATHVRECLRSQPRADAPARGGRRRAPLDETVALFVSAVNDEPESTWNHLWKRCGERLDLPLARDRAFELGLVHVKLKADFNAAGRPIQRKVWYTGPAGSCDPVDLVSGSSLKDARSKAGLTQSEAADCFGVETSTLCGWERGHHEIPAARQEIARRLVSGGFVDSTTPGVGSKS